MINLRPYQIEAKDAVLNEWEQGRKHTLLVLPTGCHALGEKLLMADGSIREVENIHEGDTLLGPDGGKRHVLVRTEGRSDMYRVIPVKGKSFMVTGEHKLTLVQTNTARSPKYPSDAHGGEIIDVSVTEYLQWSNNRKHIYKLMRAEGIERFHSYNTRDLPISPYFLGILLGDGEIKNSISVTTADNEVSEMLCTQAERYGMTLRCEPAGKATTYYFVGSGLGRKGSLLHRQLSDLELRRCGSADKFVPFVYKTAPKNVRLQVVAGLLDSDGYLNCGCYDFISKSMTLSNDLAFMCRSLGLAAYVTPCEKGCNGHSGTYYRVTISGNCSMIPCRVARRIASDRMQKKDVLRTGFRIEYCGIAPYIGFTVDGDNHYLLDDFTVTHNCGKTIVFSSIVENRVRNGGRALIMAHRGELLEQAADKLRSVSGIECALEKAESSGIGTMFPVTVGSVQTLCQPRRLQRIPQDYFTDIVVDEAHHCMSDSYQKVLEHFPDAHVLGVTATPDRSDHKDLGQYFESLAYEYTMTKAVREGYLCPITAQQIPLELNISDVSVTAGDFSANDIGEALEPYLQKIAIEMRSYCMNRKTVVFLPLIKTSMKFCAMLKECGFRAAEVDGNSEDRAEILRDFEQGKYNVLCNSMLLTEGWDCPSVDCVVVLRPTKVRALYQQMVGRGMRLSPGKENLLLLDFLWLTDRHDLCKPSSLISKSEDIAARVDKMVTDNEYGVDIIEAEEEAERDAVAEREKSLARELSVMRCRTKRLVDPLQYAMSIAAEDLANYEPSFGWEMLPPTQKQLSFLEKRGIDPQIIENAGKASMIIDKLMRRQQEGLSTPKQIRLLEKYGFLHVGTWTFEAAGSMISRLASNNWHLPYGYDAAAYRP